MTDTKILFDGYKRFYAKHFLGDIKLYERLARKGQNPKTLAIACSDSRLNPSILLDTKPGEVFVIRNVANLVPPYQPEEGDGLHGTSAALEFAIKSLNIEHIIVLGHSGCGGIKALVDGDEATTEKFTFIGSWLEIAKDARKRTLEKCQHTKQDPYSTCEKEGIITSLDNLLTFPWIKEKVDQGNITLHGWYLSIHNGKLFTLSSEDGEFKETPLDSTTE